MIYALTTRVAEAVLRLRAGLGGSAELRERLVLGAIPGRADIWIHGASVGELTSARPIIEALAEKYSILVTVNSRTGRNMVEAWDFPVRLAPLDLPGVLGRFLDSVQPKLALTIEGEFWPLKSRWLAERGIAQATIGARMSERSAAKWMRIRGVIAPILGRIAALSAQDQGSELRLLSLGLPETAVLPRFDLKLLAPAGVIPPEDSPDRDHVILAASTHEGEDSAMLDGWLAARAKHPRLKLILAPRHPNRGDDIATMMRGRGLAFQRRSEGAEDAELLLADTLGEMPIWYARAGICIIGGSFVDKGGHTPWEPAAYRCALLHGPHVSNHAQNFSLLAQAGGAMPASRENLGAILTRLTNNPAEARQMGACARGLLDRNTGNPAALIERLEALVKITPRHDI